MITKLLIFSTFDFATYVLCFFVFLSAGFILLDSWGLNKKKKSIFIQSLGFFLLAFVYASYAASPKNEIIKLIIQSAKIFSLLGILISLMSQPILKKPDDKSKFIAGLIILPLIESSLIPLSAVIFLMISIWYTRRFKEGLDKQLKLPAISFLLFFLSETIKVSFFWSDTQNVFWSKILSIHSWIWNIHIFLLLAGAIILGIWVWGYIRFRLRIQLFTIFLGAIYTIFIITTVFFSYLLLKNLETNTLSHLKTDANVFLYALERLEFESLSHAEMIAADTDLKEFVKSGESGKLYEKTSEFLIKQNLTNLTVISKEGIVLARGEDRENYGESINKDSLFESAITGQKISTLISEEHPINPAVYVKSAVPIEDSGEIIGVITVSFIIDNAFADGIKDVTNLDTTIFANDKRAATTLTGSDGKSKFTGTAESDSQITDTVLDKGNPFVGQTEIFNEPYYSAYIPLTTYGGETTGMLFIGKPQTELKESAQNAINKTFLGSVIIMILSVAPAYFISKYMEKNIEA